MLIVGLEPITLYCDASRSEGGRFTAVAGAIASVADWLRFDAEWSAALRDNEVRYFRMSEFAQSVGEFKRGWKKNERRRRAFLERLARVIVSHVACWIGAGVYQREYDAADVVYQLHEFLHPYPLCGLTCVEIAHAWREAKRFDYLPIEYVFEEGDQHADQLRKTIYDKFGKYPLFRKKFGDQQTPKLPTTPLQVGDFAAYELQKAYSILDAANADLFDRFRTSFLLLGSIPHKWGELPEVAIRTELNLRGIPKRQAS